MSSSSIILHNVSVTLTGNQVLQDVSFTLNDNEHLAIIGASGSGKTTLAKVLAGQLFAAGEYKIGVSKNSLLQTTIAFIQQRYQFKNLSNVSDFYYQQRFNSFDAQDAPTILQELSHSKKELSECKIDELLTQLGLEHRKNAPLIQLSSGEHKRFQIIKALLALPQILILDMPFVGLDKTARKQLQHIINNLAANGTQIIVITDAHEVPHCITHIAYLEEGGLKDFVPKEAFDFESVESHKAHHHFNIDEIPLLQSACDFENAVSMKNVSVNYGDKNILSHINWQIRQGDKWLLKGHNGAGKSTLLSLINGDNPQAYKNEIYLFDKRRGTGESIWDIKQKIGYVSPELHAFYDKNTTCYNTVASGFFDTIGLFKKLSLEQHKVVQEWIHFLNLTTEQHKPLASLSFGTQRLIFLGRALIKNPPLLILDEPCQGLDEEQKDNFVHLINDLCERLNKTLIYVSHYSNEVPPCIDHVLELKQGKQRIYSINKNKELIEST